MRTIFTNTVEDKNGFTVVELLVSVGILTVITAGLLVQNRSFNNSVLLSTLAHDVALSIRQAQIFGISVRGVGNDFETGYGVQFDNADPTNYIFFADLNEDRSYDAGELIETYSLSRNYTIRDICGINTGPSGDEETCFTSGTKLAIVFERPNPNAYFTRDPGGGTFRAARIYIRAPGGKDKSVTVESTGQITVD